MYTLLTSALLLVLASPAPATAPTKPNTLTPQEIADGWLLLFDGETTFGWKTEGEVRAEQGIFALGGVNASVATATTTFASFELSFEYRTEGKGEPFLQLLTPTMLPATKGPGWEKCHAQMAFDTVRGAYAEQVSYPGGSGKVKADKVAESQVPLPVKIGVYPEGKLLVTNLKIRPLRLNSLFNGKDLTGWKEFPGKKSKFTVNDKGELNIKDGPGDLQTEGQWDDFVLQLECISNGEHLNSGVFFRCRPGEYQNGYEAQIRNQFTAEPAQEYTLEEYDPQTHQLVGKKKARYTAVDYGTGAIYRRQPARREVARDHAWFTLTLVAHGNHLATWVNGIQVTDWTDNRPRSDNARNGCRLEPGPISLQGHDPTTDLSFRNLRIAEFPTSLSPKQK